MGFTKEDIIEEEWEVVKLIASQVKKNPHWLANFQNNMAQERRIVNYFQNRRPTRPLKDLEYNVTLEMLRAIPGIGLKHALTLSKGFPTIEKLVDASVQEMSSLQGVGSKLASSV